MFTQDTISITQRVTAPKPPLFRRILKIVGTITAVATVVAAAPVAAPVATVAGIIAAIGGGITAASTLPVDFDKLNAQQANQ